MNSRALKLLAHSEQIESLIERIESDLTSEAERQVLFLALGRLVFEGTREGWFELDDGTLNKVLNVGRVRSAVRRARVAWSAAQSPPTLFRSFTIGYFSSLTASLTVPVIIGLIILAVLLANNVSITAILELIQVRGS